MAGRGEAAPGDHLQSAYRLWLPGHQLERGAAPWRDPYSFQPESEPRVNFAAWPFGLVFWPLVALLGVVAAWNTFVLLAYLAGGGFTARWLRELDMSVGAALVGGLVFALAPYLVGQSAAGHLVAPTAVLLPLALFFWERRWPVPAAAALASIPLSGQVHLALGALPFFFLYAWLRAQSRTERLVAVAATGVSVAAGALVYVVSIRGTVGAGGRSFAQVERYSAEWADLVAREVRHGLESFVFLGWLTPLLALGGAAALVVAERRRLALALGIGALVPVLAALGANTPLYEPLWQVVPGLRHTRVPERLMPVACLAIAGLVAFAADRVRPRVALALLVPLLFLDLHVEVYRPTAADEQNAAYAGLQRQPAGRLVELPVYLPDRQEGSVYLYYAMQAPRERPAGYSTTAPPEADALMRRLRRLTCRGAVRKFRAELRRLGVRYVMLHRGLRGCVPPLSPRGFPPGTTVLLRVEYG